MTPPKARFGGIDIVCKDMPASVAFYRELGIDIPDEKIWSDDSGPQHVDLKLVDDGKFGVSFDIDTVAMTTGYSPAWKDSAAAGAASMVSFRVDSNEDVDALHDHLVSLGHPSHLAPWDAFWGARFAIVVDPDGNHVSIMGPMKDA
jgi:catechol 2,3-dioxygenase-like lactoylglutathione lyase family enzyme